MSSINSLPKIKLISVEEKLPEKSGKYIVYGHDGADDYMPHEKEEEIDRVFIADYDEESKTFGEWCALFPEFLPEFSEITFRPINVKAWAEIIHQEPDADVTAEKGDTGIHRAEKQPASQNDLISRKEAYDTLSEYYHHSTETQHAALKEALDKVPPFSGSEDLVSVIRCRNCEYFGDYVNGSYCTRPYFKQGAGGFMTGANGFCDKADRKAARRQFKEGFFQKRRPEAQFERD